MKCVNELMSLEDALVRVTEAFTDGSFCAIILHGVYDESITGEEVFVEGV